MKIKTNDRLFYEVYEYASRVTKMVEIIEKNGEISQEEYKEWAVKGLKNLDDIKDWIKRVAKHIQENQ